MQHDTIMGTRSSVQFGRSVDCLREEIAFFEGRLTQIGDAGDCAYERALSRIYRVLLVERRNQLAKLS